MIEHETASDAPDTRYDDLIARLRDAAFGVNRETMLRYAERLDAENWLLTARIVRVVADVIA